MQPTTLLSTDCHNYCDRWCERCPAASRCRVQTVLRAGGAPSSWPGTALARSTDLPDVATLRAAIHAEARATCHRGGWIAEAARPVPRAFLRRWQQVSSDMLVDLARDYAAEAIGWMLSLGDALVAACPAMQEPVRTIRHDALVIATKVHRGVFAAREPEGGPATERDCLGSIKVGLLSMDRSMAAWQDVERERRRLARPSATPVDLLGVLRVHLECRYPAAREHVRAGLDDAH